MPTRGDVERVVVLAPLGRDAELAVGVLASAGFDALACGGAADLEPLVAKGVGAVVLTEEAITAEVRASLEAILAAQPPWSDLPVVLCGAAERGRRDASHEWLGNVTLVDRPVRSRTLTSAVRTALRGRRRQYEARRAIERRDEFLAMLGHELRNPLSPILFGVQLIARYAPDLAGKAAHQLGIIDRQARRLSRLVDDLLDVARVTSGKVEIQREPVQLGSLVGRCVQAAEAQAQMNNVRLAAAPGDDHVRVSGDALRLEQVVANLVGNAVKYTPSGGQVEVSTAREEGEAVIRVRDTGTGIEPRLLESIFELFEQVPTTLDRSQGGLGLGLTLVRSLVELHGGRVRALSDGPGKGSTFEVRLPLLDRVEDARAAARVEAPSSTLSLVVVDDNPDIRDALVDLLAGAGHRVEAVGDGVRALARILATRPDAAVIDIGLPGLDGYEVARRVRSALPRGVCLIALTGYGQPDDRKRAFEAGFDVHLTKPISIEALEAALCRAEEAPALAH